MTAVYDLTDFSIRFLTSILVWSLCLEFCIPTFLFLFFNSPRNNLKSIVKQRNTLLEVACNYSTG